MKKIIIPIISLILVVTAFLWPSDALLPTVSAGVGNDGNDEIKKPEKLTELLEFAYLRMSEDASGYDISKKDSDYESFTVIESTVIKSSSRNQGYIDDYYGSTGTVSSSSSTLNRTRVIYVTEDESYYIIKGTYSFEYEDFVGDDDSYSVNVIFDMLVYLSEDDAMFKFNTLEMSGDDVERIDKELIGKWYSLPREGAEEVFELVDYASGCSEYLNFAKSIEYAVENDEFDKSGKKYTLQFATLNENDSELLVDLTDSERPYIEVTVDGSSSDGFRETYRCETIAFSNIGNTVINVRDRDVEEFDDVDEFYEFLEDMIDE